MNHDFIHVVVLEGFGTEIWFYTSNGMLYGCLHYGSIAPITFNLDCYLHKTEQVNLWTQLRYYQLEDTKELRGSKKVVNLMIFEHF